jgi:CheY-like chemotaxis protein
VAVIEDTEPFQILLVEDSASDISLTRESLRDARVPNQINVVRDGIEAMDYLHGRGEFAGRPRPDLVLLDLNMPRKSGREVLTEMKGDVSLMQIPVVVLSTSTADRDINDSYQLHANAYVSKPVALDDFIAAVGAVQRFWMETARLPAGAG